MRLLMFLFLVGCAGGGGDKDTGNTGDTHSGDTGETDSGDSGDTGETDSGDSGDTGETDSGDSGDTGETDSGDTDTGDTGRPPPDDVDGDGFDEFHDCDDNDAAVNPEAPEVCNRRDDDCDTLVDELDDDLTDAVTYYPDADADRYGVAEGVVRSCLPLLDGYATDPGDCDDTNPRVNPGVTEACNGLDDDCDGSVDEDGTPTVWYLDADADDWGRDDSTTEACARPRGYAAVGGDCGDLDPLVFPGAPEVCDEADNNCDGAVDEGVLSTWYRDNDEDLYGDFLAPVEACEAPYHFVADSSDCDDTEASVHPDAPEVCGDAVDNDCDPFTVDTCA